MPWAVPNDHLNSDLISATMHIRDGSVNSGFLPKCTDTYLWLNVDNTFPRYKSGGEEWESCFLNPSCSASASSKAVLIVADMYQNDRTMAGWLIRRLDTLKRVDSGKAECFPIGPGDCMLFMLCRWFELMALYIYIEHWALSTDRHLDHVCVSYNHTSMMIFRALDPQRTQSPCSPITKTMNTNTLKKSQQLNLA